MNTCEVSAVLFARDKSRVAAFYRDVLGLICTAEDEDHSVLNCRGFDFIVHQIPKHLLAECSVEEESRRKENGSIRLNYPVVSIEKVRTLAASLGGHVDVAPPDWAPRDANFFLGHDPEGNVFKISEQSR
ncbi:MAG: VOC family protein [Steroidobacteraceae bacterium]